MRLFWRIFLTLLGWDTSLVYPYRHLKKAVIIVGPHTSNWDFVIGLAYRSMLGLTNTSFLGKKELFVPPFGWFFRMLGGIPVDRRNNKHVVADVVNHFRSREEFLLALSPEGTRKKVEKLRTGFYFIADLARVPIIMVGIDWKHRTLLFGEPLLPCSQEDDFETILSFYGPIEGRYPEQGMMNLKKSGHMQE